jgi:cobalt-zinc-cadmium efflux system outer membrane protein
LQQSTALAESRRIELLTALEGAYARHEVATQQIQAFEAGLLRQAEDALRVAEAAYRFGERGFIEVLDAQRVLRSVRLDFLNTRFAQRAAYIDIEQLRAIDLEGIRP